VDTDPLRTGGDPLPVIIGSTGLSRLGNWQFLGGPLTALDSVWQNYGVSIKVSTASGTVAHNNVMYFVDPNGRLRIRATPVADESANATFSLPSASVSRSGAGIATYAESLLPTKR
jgi:cytochrome oxidase Cu insertion factor (SCO1/SenC/PrrC family)